ncbi:SDR family NAD(P)-dependent oxidoreductase [Nonomuraea sediminis]|uniref:SDR family NAD(P)-dependent oxidoreductase n=1 Tax=Nonomuraea sediminis TaxID=2835864 RepID=UPI001BDCD79E|nr:SDR family NAD(P)-dependent oxidoreductase [Nonomuraea sediminis]
MSALLLTGASGGVGTATARELLARGYTVYAGVRDPARAPDGTRPVVLEVTDPASVEAAAAEIAETENALHAVINNAGVIVDGPLEEVPDEELRRQFAVNVFGPAAVTRAFLPLLRRGGGRVVNVSAASARTALPYMAPISASKAALESLSDALRVELAAWRIPVVVVEPGALDTPIFAKAAQARRGYPAGLYRDQLAKFDAAMAKQTYAPTERVARVIATAVTARRPRPRYVTGRDARLAAILSHLPIGLRDRLLVGALGL